MNSEVWLLWETFVPIGSQYELAELIDIYWVGDEAWLHLDALARQYGVALEGDAHKFDVPKRSHLETDFYHIEKRSVSGQRN